MEIQKFFISMNMGSVFILGVCLDSADQRIKKPAFSLKSASSNSAQNNLKRKEGEETQFKRLENEAKFSFQFNFSLSISAARLAPLSYYLCSREALTRAEHNSISNRFNFSHEHYRFRTMRKVCSEKMEINDE